MIKPACTPTILLRVRRLETSDVAAYRELRLESLKGHLEAFGSSWEYEMEKPISWWSQRLETDTVFGMAKIGEFRESMELINEAVRSVEANGDLIYMPELLRVKGNVLGF